MNAVMLARSSMPVSWWVIQCQNSRFVVVMGLVETSPTFASSLFIMSGSLPYKK